MYIKFQYPPRNMMGVSPAQQNNIHDEINERRHFCLKNPDKSSARVNIIDIWTWLFRREIYCGHSVYNNKGKKISI